MTDRPIDVLDKAKGKKILIKLKTGEDVTGTLKALDLHLNIWVEDAEVRKGDSRVRFGTMLIRGDTIVYASPVM